MSVSPNTIAVRILIIAKLLLIAVSLCHFVYKYLLFETVYQRAFGAAIATQMTLYLLTSLVVVKFIDRTGVIAAVLLAEMILYVVPWLFIGVYGANYLSLILIAITASILIIQLVRKPKSGS